MPVDRAGWRIGSGLKSGGWCGRELGGLQGVSSILVES